MRQSSSAKGIASVAQSSKDVTTSTGYETKVVGGVVQKVPITVSPTYIAFCNCHVSLVCE